MVRFSCLLLVFPCLVVSAAGAQGETLRPSEEGLVRVHVLSQAAIPTVTLRAESGPVDLFLDHDPAPAATLHPGESVEISRLHGRLSLDAPTATRQASSVEAVPSPGAHVEVRAGALRRAYRGMLAVALEPGGRTLRLVNHVPLEAYVASVVASEYPFAELEGVKAQAVVARTYALRRRDPAAPFDLSDDTRSQVYNGLGAETAVSRTATEETRGEILTWLGEPAEATYYSSSGGHTAGNEEVWAGRPVPYLRPRPDPYDADAPDHRWSTAASAPTILGALSRRFGGSVSGIEAAQHSPSGRVTEMRLLGPRPRTITASAFRAAVNAAAGSRTIRSTFFTVEREGSRFVFRGRGFGHGVGMSQYGARGQARAGHSYRDILDFYFAGTSLDRRDGAADAPVYAEYTGPIRRRPTPRHVARTATADAIVEQLSTAPAWSGPTAEDGSENDARRTAW